MKMTCELCGEVTDGGLSDGLEHIRLVHPAEYGDGIETWADGSPVVIDTTIEPGDFA